MQSFDTILAASPESLVRSALVDLASRGAERVAIYGAGQHTRKAEGALCHARLTVVGIIDDEPSRQGQLIAGLPIISSDHALQLGVQAVILSSDSAEDALYQRTVSLRARGVEIVRLYGTTDPSGSGPRGQRLLMWPTFASQEELSDHWIRMLWYLAPMLGDIEEIVVPVAYPGLRPGKTPSYLDPSLIALQGMFKRVVRFVESPDASDLKAHAQRCDALLAWRSESSSSRAITRVPVSTNGSKRTVNIYHVDHLQDRRADTAYLHISEEMNPRAREELLESREKFAKMLSSRDWGNIGYVFGTGPSLSAAANEHDFSDGTPIVCNSMVRNKALMSRLCPPIVTVADPIFHAGPSKYAAEFRTHLARVMHEYGSWLVVPWRDYRIYMAHMDAELRERIVGVPFVNAQTPNVDLRRRFEVSSTSNILTLFMLPLAATLFREVRVMGCDGRPLNENNYFWKHDPANQIVERMDDIKRAHPSFFNISYDDYYATHCTTLQKWIESAEASGVQVVNLTPSYIPALAQRTHELVTARVAA